MREEQTQILLTPWTLERLWKRTALILDMVKFPHTIFALPVALMATFLAARGWPAWDKLGLIILAMTGARNGAMAFNRLADTKYDVQNPRTCTRALPAGKISSLQVTIFITICSTLFILSAYLLGPLPFALSPVALAVIYTYSYTKRFTSYSHLFLGLSLGIAPIGAWIGIRGRIEPLPLFIALATLLWVAGFDIIYSCLDADFDHRVGLYSIPQRFGLRRALQISAVLYALMFAVLVLIMYLGQLHIIYGFGLLVIGGLLIYQHIIVKPNDLSRANLAFCTINGIISMVLFLFTVTDLFWFSV